MLIHYFEAESNTIFGGGFPYMVFTVLNWCDQITNLRIAMYTGPTPDASEGRSTHHQSNR